MTVLRRLLPCLFAVVVGVMAFAWSKPMAAMDHHHHHGPVAAAKQAPDPMPCHQDTQCRCLSALCLPVIGPGAVWGADLSAPLRLPLPSSDLACAQAITGPPAEPPRV